MAQEALDDSTRKMAAITAKMRSAEKPGARILEEGLELYYSRDDDYLTATIGAPKPSVSIPAGPIYLLVDPDSGQINALEVPFFLEVWQEGRLRGPLWEIAHRLVEAGHSTVYIPPQRDLEEAAEAAQDLIPA